MEIGKTVKIFDPTTFVLSLHSLPEDIQLHIFSLLSRKELHIASRVCQRWVINILIFFCFGIDWEFFQISHSLFFEC